MEQDGETAVKPDAECRNTMFNGKAQTAVRLLPKLKEFGVSTFRLEALFETSNQIREKVLIYSEIISANSSSIINSEYLKKINATEQYGVTDGQLFNISKFRDRKKNPINTMEL
jgi:putative protease